MKKFFRFLLWLFTFLLVGLFAACLINFQVLSYSNNKIYPSVEEVPNDNQVAIVLGAKVWGEGAPSFVLEDRIITAVNLYKAGKVKKLLMSGDNPTKEYDEPTTMKLYAIKLGVPENDIVLDFAGRRTYDTCWRAKNIFGAEKAVMISQDFHLGRAIYLCENLGVEASGVSANLRPYDGENYWAFREFFARCSAWFEINFFPFEPIKGEKEPIKID